MDLHLSPLPTHPALIIRGMRTSTRGMSGYRVEFMMPTRRRALGGVAQDSSSRSRRNRRRLDAREIIPAITLRLGRSSASSTPRGTIDEAAISVLLNDVGSILIRGTDWEQVNPDTCEYMVMHPVSREMSHRVGLVREMLYLLRLNYRRIFCRRRIELTLSRMSLHGGK